MLTKLSKKQQALIPVVRDEWVQMALGGDTSVDLPAVHTGVHWVYEQAKLKKPDIILVLDSPYACQLAANMLRKKQVRLQVAAQVLEQVGVQVRVQVWDQVLEQVWEQVLEQVRVQVWEQVRAQVLEQVLAQVLAQVGAQVRDGKLEYFEFTYISLGTNTGWFAWADFFTRIGALKHDGMQRLINLARAGVFEMITLDGACIISRRPSSVKRDTHNKLHCTTGPAITFPDGWESYRLHGELIDIDAVCKEHKCSKQQAIKIHCVEQQLQGVSA